VYIARKGRGQAECLRPPLPLLSVARWSSCIHPAHLISVSSEERLPSGERYELILEAVGKAKTSPLKVQCKTALSAKGTYVSVDDGRPQIRTHGLRFLKDLVETGKLQAVIDRTHRLEQMADAHRYVETGHSRGNVGIAVAHQAPSPEGSI